MSYLRARIAHKEFPCAYKRHLIKVGERYTEEVFPPWTLISDDVDEFGRTVWRESGMWDTIRYHSECRNEQEMGI
jgi:hypothetical protein